jgi:hypothetical protein
MPEQNGGSKMRLMVNRVTAGRLAGGWVWICGAALVVASVVATPASADSGYQARLVRTSIEPPYRSQFDGSIYAVSDCGPAVLGMALDDYGVEVDTLQLRQLTHTYQGTWPAVRVGTALQYVAEVANDFGLSTDGLYDDAADGVFHQWSVDEIAAQVASGRLVIPLVRYGLLPGHETTGVRWGHYILVYAVDGDGFLYQDPAFRPVEAGHARWISREQLDGAMAPVYPPRQAVALGGA